MGAWLGHQFKECMLFRRLYLVFMGAYIGMVTYYSFQYLFYATDKGSAGGDILANLAAVVAFPSMIMKMLYDKYSSDRGEK